MTSLGQERLLKLANHLKYGQLGHKEFDITLYNSGSSFDEKGCGTAGCAIGECPILWPEYWYFRWPRFGRAASWGPDPTLLEDGIYTGNPFDSAQIFFELNPFESNQLFSSYYISSADWNKGFDLGNFTAQDVGDAILRYIDYKIAGMCEQ